MSTGRPTCPAAEVLPVWGSLSVSGAGQGAAAGLYGGRVTGLGVESAQFACFQYPAAGDDEGGGAQ